DGAGMPGGRIDPTGRGPVRAGIVTVDTCIRSEGGDALGPRRPVPEGIGAARVARSGSGPAHPGHRSRSSERHRLQVEPAPEPIRAIRGRIGAGWDHGSDRTTDRTDFTDGMNLTGAGLARVPSPPGIAILLIRAIRAIRGRKRMRSNHGSH